MVLEPLEKSVPAHLDETLSSLHLPANQMMSNHDTMGQTHLGPSDALSHTQRYKALLPYVPHMAHQLDINVL